MTPPSPSRVLAGVMAGLSLLLTMPMTALEPGLPSKTAVWAMAARALGAMDPDPALRNPDYLAIKFLGPRERALLSDYPLDALDLDYGAAMRKLQYMLPVKSHAFRTRAFDDALVVRCEKARVRCSSSVPA